MERPIPRTVHAHIPSSDRRDEGFTLVELLIVIVILGVLSTVTVFAVNGIASRGESAATSADEQTVVRAQEAYYALYSTYGTEAELLAEGLLNRESTTHDITLVDDGEDYTLVAQGAGGTVTTTPGPVWPQGQVDQVVFQGMNAEQYGNGPQVAVLIPGQDSNQSLDMDWGFFTTTQPAIPGVTMYYIDDSQVDTLAELDLVIDNSDFQVLAVQTQIEGQWLTTYGLNRTESGWPAPEYDRSTVFPWHSIPGMAITDFRTFVTEDFQDGDPIGRQVTFAGFDAWVPGDAQPNQVTLVVIGTPGTRESYNEFLLGRAAGSGLNRGPTLYIEDPDLVTIEQMHAINTATTATVLIPANNYPAYQAEYGVPLSEVRGYSSTADIEFFY